MEKYETLSRCKNENKSKIDSLSSSSPQSYLVSENHRDTTTNNNSSHSPPTSSSHNHHRHEDRLYSSSCSSPSSSDEIVSIPSLSHNISSTSYQLNDIYSPNGIRQSMLLESSTSFN
nr:SJCHGC03238 protein [Schistosoma japonicum]